MKHTHHLTFFILGIFLNFFVLYSQAIVFAGPPDILLNSQNQCYSLFSKSQKFEEILNALAQQKGIHGNTSKKAISALEKLYDHTGFNGLNEQAPQCLQSMRPKYVSNFMNLLTSLQEASTLSQAKANLLEHVKQKFHLSSKKARQRLCHLSGVDSPCALLNPEFCIGGTL